MQLPCTNGVAWSIFSALSPPRMQHKDRTVFICLIALEHYVNMYIVSLRRDRAPMGLNSASKEGNLKASNECPLTYVSLSHTHKWTSTSSCRRVRRPICARGTHGHRGGGMCLSLSSAMVGCWVLNAMFVNGLFNNEASFGASIYTQGCYLVTCPESTWITKGRVGSLGPRTPEGSSSLIMFV